LPVLNGSVDVAACTARGIEVSHTPAAVDHATATVGAFLTISALRQFYRAEVNVRNGKWKQGLQPATDPEGKVVGIIGMGGIGSVRIVATPSDAC
jgi:lactate dehydrogenase-like 2-hydroxyacid dehydrogenase